MIEKLKEAILKLRGMSSYKIGSAVFLILAGVVLFKGRLFLAILNLCLGVGLFLLSQKRKK